MKGAQLSFEGLLSNNRRRFYEDLTNRSFGKLKVLCELERTDRNGHREIFWHCRCACRQVVEKRTADLTSGKVTSCGCEKKKRVKSLGKSRFQDLTGEKFGSLTVIKKAKIQPIGNIKWLCYCARCDRKKQILSTNLLSGRTKTCGCATKDKQIKITAFQSTRTISEWSRAYGCSKQLIIYRLKQGWTTEDAVSKPPRFMKEQSSLPSESPLESH